MTKYKVTILPSNQVVEVSEEMNLLEALRAQDVYIKSSCGGVASCSDCIIKISAGSDYLNSPSFEEERLLGNVFHITKERLSCQTKISGDVIIDISKHDKQADQQKLLSKTNKFSKVRKSKDIPEKQVEEEVPKKPKVGGLRRPKGFKENYKDED